MEDIEIGTRVKPLWKYIKQDDGSINIKIGDALHGPVLKLESLICFYVVVVPKLVLATIVVSPPP